MTVSTVGDEDEQQSELGEDGVKWHQMAIKMEGNTEMDRVLLGRTSEFQVSTNQTSSTQLTHHRSIFIKETNCEEYHI